MNDGLPLKCPPPRVAQNRRRRIPRLQWRPLSAKGPNRDLEREAASAGARELWTVGAWLAMTLAGEPYVAKLRSA